MKKENINITQWWCTYSQVYGSPIMGFKSPEIGSLSLSEDKKTLAVKIPVQEKQVFCLDLAKLLSADGKQIQNTKAYYTLINLVK